jgi:hypothetical protein
MLDRKILISHRGNVDGENKEWENHPDYIEFALEDGYDVEIDIWLKNNKWYLGHDVLQYEIPFDFLLNDHFWIHCKNYESLQYLSLYYKNNNESKLNFFFHNNDSYTLTSKGYIWAYPNNFGHKNTIAVLPELYHTNINSFDGICSDYINFYRNILW